MYRHKYSGFVFQACFLYFLSDGYLLGKKCQGRFTAASEYFNSLDFSLLFTMIRRQKFYGVWQIVSGELGGGRVGSICTNPSMLLYHLNANLKLGPEQI